MLLSRQGMPLRSRVERTCEAVHGRLIQVASSGPGRGPRGRRAGSLVFASQAAEFASATGVAADVQGPRASTGSKKIGAGQFGTFATISAQSCPATCCG